MIEALDKLEVITLFVEDLSAAKTFYLDVFGLSVLFEDEVSVAAGRGPLIINILNVSEAHALIEPAAVAARESGSRFMLTIAVEDANAVCQELRRHGVALLNGPIDRPWGRRTASFADPAGNVWEIAQVLPRPA